MQSDAATSSWSSIDPAEIEKFAAMADDWWDPAGKFKPLHDLAPVRMGFIRDHAVRHFNLANESFQPLDGMRVLDIGCGGGLLTEPMARLGAKVVGIDATKQNIGVARTHAEAIGLTIDYRVGTAEDMADSNPGDYDIVLCLEVVEHVADVDAFMAACAATLRPGGLMIASTINRSAKAFALAIVGAEYVMRWLPRGTHNWRKFLRPSELARTVRPYGLETRDAAGIVYNPMSGLWRLDQRDLAVNYMMAFEKTA